MPIREDHPLRCQPVRPRRRDLPMLRVQAMHIAITEVIADEEDDVRVRGEERRAESDEDKNQPEHFHTAETKACMPSVHQSLSELWYCFAAFFV